MILRSSISEKRETTMPDIFVEKQSEGKWHAIRNGARSQLEPHRTNVAAMRKRNILMIHSSPGESNTLIAAIRITGDACIPTANPTNPIGLTAIQTSQVRFSGNESGTDLRMSVCVQKSGMLSFSEYTANRMPWARAITGSCAGFKPTSPQIDPNRRSKSTPL